LAPSLIARADYTVKGSVQQVFPLTLAADGVLHAGIRLHLVTNSTVNSKTAQVGDIHVSLCQQKSTGVRGALWRARIATLQDSPHASKPLG